MVMEVQKQVKRICQTCGANRAELLKMLREPPVKEDNGMGGTILLESENHTLSGIILSNCPACQLAVKILGKRLAEMREKES